jgi:hypothetical protein
LKNEQRLLSRVISNKEYLIGLNLEHFVLFEKLYHHVCPLALLLQIFKKYALLGIDSATAVSE